MDNINEIAEFLQPARTALVLWDIQKMLVESIFNREEFLGKVETLAASAREKLVPVFLTKITPLPERFQSPGSRFMMRRRAQGFKPGPDAYTLVLNPETDDIVLNKNTASIFVGTNFELMIRNAGLSTILFTGISTEFGIESSAREASTKGFFPIVISDAVSSRSQEGHSRSLENMKSILPLVTTAELVSFWKKLPA
ncbi:MAG TPA: isochorismatase family cysteine hydrolase [Candidatus Acidoferrales bacterium]|nr:isochorismatase family cysteine hydrolase [Candidatus Acidoferrales bacterium]